MLLNLGEWEHAFRSYRVLHQSLFFHHPLASGSDSDGLDLEVIEAGNMDQLVGIDTSSFQVAVEGDEVGVLFQGDILCEHVASVFFPGQLFDGSSVHLPDQLVQFSLVSLQISDLFVFSELGADESFKKSFNFVMVLHLVQVQVLDHSDHCGSAHAPNHIDHHVS